MIQKYVELDGISGSEEIVIDEFIKDIRGHVDKVEKLPLGAAVATIYGKSEQSIMIAAHADEVGLMISYVTKEGYAYFVPIGGLDPATLIGQEVRFGDKYGVIGSVPPHMKPANAPAAKLEDLWIDMGDQEHLKIGDVGVINSEYRELGDRIVGKALDDRAGVAAMVQAVLELGDDPQPTIHIVASTQEETGLTGIRGAVERYNPDIVFAIDVTMCSNSPGIPVKKAPIKMGEGPVIVLADGAGRGIISDKNLVSHVKELAKWNNIPLQEEVSSGGTTDATIMQIVGEGRAAATLSIPSEYIHSPRSMISKKDYDNLVKLIKILFQSLYIKGR